MKFDTVTIEGKTKKKQIEEGYYVKIEYMYGDADGNCIKFHVKPP